MKKRYNGDLGKTKSQPRKKTKTRTRENGEEEEGNTKTGKEKKNYSLVDTIEEQVKLLRRFKNMAGKTIPVTRLLTFIKSLQRAVHERRVRKGDRYASEIDQAQRIVIQTYQRANGKNVEVKVSGALLERVIEIAKSQKVRPSVLFLKRFVGFIGKPYHEVMKRIRKLLENLQFMYDRGLIKQTDPYFDKVRIAQRALEKAHNDRERITVPSATLSGLNGIVAREGQQDSDEENGLDGLDYPEDDEEDHEKQIEVSTSKQIAQTEYDKLPFEGFYQRLLSFPARDFWMVVYGLPFQGKTTFSIGFAKYLAENMGNVLYVTSEQYQSEGLKQVINRVQAGDLNQLHFTPSLEKAPPLTGYDFIFIDSANAANLTIEQMVDLREENKGKAFITILQSTKAGDFRGDQRWRHLPSIVMKIHECKATIEKNQYHSGGLVTLSLPKLPPLQPQESFSLYGLDGKDKEKSVRSWAGYHSSIVGIAKMIGETKSSIQRMMKDTPKKVAERLVPVLQETVRKQGARVRIERFAFADVDSVDNVNGIVFFTLNLLGKPTEIKKVGDDCGGKMFILHDEEWDEKVV